MEKNKNPVPLRTCVSCGAKRDKKKLIRLVLDANGRIIRDVEGKMNGRGAYVCSEKACWERLKKGNRLTKAFRVADPVLFNEDFKPLFLG